MDPLFLAGVPGIVVWFSLATAALLVILVSQSLAIIETSEKGAVFVFGSYKRLLDPGVHLVVPVVSTVERIDMRSQTLEFEDFEGQTQDSCDVCLDVSLYFRVKDAEAAATEVADFEEGVYHLSQTCVKSVLREHSGETVATDPVSIQDTMLDEFDDAIADWGLEAQHVEIQNVDVEQFEVERVPVTGPDD